MNITIAPQSVLVAIDDSLLGATLYVPPSGDTTGDADTEAIQRAVDSLQGSLTGMARGTVLLSGVYHVRSPITLGAVNVHSRVAICGHRHATLVYAGDPTSDYMVRIFGKNTGAPVLLSGLTLYGRHKTRGVLVSYATTRCLLDCLQLHSTREVGMDLHRCWGLSVSNTMFHSPQGYALRGYNANACHFSSLSIAGGTDAAWPSDEDTYCQHFDGTPYRVPAAERAAIHLEGNGSLFSLLMLEALKYGDRPLVYLKTNSFHFTMTRLEGNLNRLHKIVIDGGNYNVFDGVGTCDGRPLNGTDYTTPTPETACQTFVRCIGNTKANKLQRLAGNTGCTEALLLHDGGKHAGNMVTECYSVVPYMPATNHINGVNSPVVTSGFPD